MRVDGRLIGDLRDVGGTAPQNAPNSETRRYLQGPRKEGSAQQTREDDDRRRLFGLSSQSPPPRLAIVFRAVQR